MQPAAEGAWNDDQRKTRQVRPALPEREFFVDNLLVRIHIVFVIIRWTGLAPWDLEFPFPGSLTSTFLVSPWPAAPGYLDPYFRRDSPRKVRAP